MAAQNLMGQTKKSVGQQTWQAIKLGRPNTKLGGPVPSRPTSSATTAISWTHNVI